MDVQMPVMDGYQATAAIRERERHSGDHTPIIALTAHSTDRDREACYQAGMDACLSKPIDVGQLVAFVEQATQPRKLPTGVESPQGTLDTSPDATVIDLPTTMKRLGGDEELLKEFIEVFNEDAPGLLQALRSAIPEGDSASAARAAHSLRGLAANFSATSVVEAASLIEHAAKSGDLTDVDALLERLSSAVSQLRVSLSRLHPTP
jgi:CheY-like chemotaxis protein